MTTETYTVLQDYRTDRLNGGGPVVWTDGQTIDLSDDDAGWVNRDRPGTLAGPEREAEAGDALPPAPQSGIPAAAVDIPAVAADVPATTPAAEQVGGKPPRGRGRRTDSAG